MFKPADLRYFLKAPEKLTENVDQKSLEYTQAFLKKTDLRNWNKAEKSWPETMEPTENQETKSK